MHAQQSAVLLDGVVHLDDLRSREQLHDEAGRDDGRDAELHARAAVGSHDHAGPVEGIGAAGGVDAIKRQLRAHQEHEERDGGVQRALAEGNLPIRLLDLGEHREEGAHQVQDAESRRHRVHSV